MTTYSTLQAVWNRAVQAAGTMTAQGAKATSRARLSGSQWTTLQHSLTALQGGVCATCGERMNQSRDVTATAAGLFTIVPSSAWNVPTDRAGFSEGLVVVSCSACRSMLKGQEIAASALAIRADQVATVWTPDMLRKATVRGQGHRENVRRILLSKGYNV